MLWSLFLVIISALSGGDPKSPFVPHQNWMPKPRRWSSRRRMSRNSLRLGMQTHLYSDIKDKKSSLDCHRDLNCASTHHVCSVAKSWIPFWMNVVRAWPLTGCGRKTLSSPWERHQACPDLWGRALQPTSCEDTVKSQVEAEWWQFPPLRARGRLRPAQGPRACLGNVKISVGCFSLARIVKCKK